MGRKRKRKRRSRRPEYPCPWCGLEHRLVRRGLSPFARAVFLLSADRVLGEVKRNRGGL